MTTTTGNNGRLGNQIIRNLAVSLIAEKSGLKVDYSNERLINRLGIYLFSGEKIHNTTKMLNDDNYFEVYHNATDIHYNLNPNQAYFQTKEITNMLYRYLRKSEIQCEIVANNPFRLRYKANRDVFVHIRLTDAARFNPGADYYLRAIGATSFDNLYISTDDTNHPIIQTIVSKYPNAKIVKLDEITTFQFASTCAHIVLSHGSFSAVIGYLAYYSDVYYPEYESGKMWYGDMFSINGWWKI